MSRHLRRAASPDNLQMVQLFPAFTDYSPPSMSCQDNFENFMEFRQSPFLSQNDAFVSFVIGSSDRVTSRWDKSGTAFALRT
jgi:hypothetical protein